MQDVYVASACRTPVGRFRGVFSGTRADHLASHVIKEAVDRAGLSPDNVDDVILGCVTQIGEQSANIARTALLSAGWPETIPGMTVDRKCGSSEAAVHVAASSIAAGLNGIVVAGGAENMTRVPIGSNREIHGEAFGWKLLERFEMVSQGEASERLADKWGLDRRAMDEFALTSHRRAAVADDENRFQREIVSFPLTEFAELASEPLVKNFERDETIRRDTSAEKLATLKPSFRQEGRSTAGNSSQIADGAAALVLASGDAVKQFGLKPMARLRAMTTVGSDPTLMLTGPLTATMKVLEQAKLQLEDIDLFEVNEAFAPVPMIWQKEFGVSSDLVNVNGGAIALGHPLGASGARIMTTLLHELERRDGRFGLQTMCCAGGLGTATIIERLA